MDRQLTYIPRDKLQMTVGYIFHVAEKRHVAVYIVCLFCETVRWNCQLQIFVSDSLKAHE